MSIFTKHEAEILQKFRKGSIVSSDEEEVVLDRYASIGFVQFGFDWDDMVQTAKLTESGIKHLNRY